VSSVKIDLRGGRFFSPQRLRHETRRRRGRGRERDNLYFQSSNYFLNFDFFGLLWSAADTGATGGASTGVSSATTPFDRFFPVTGAGGRGEAGGAAFFSFLIGTFLSAEGGAETGEAGTGDGVSAVTLALERFFPTTAAGEATGAATAATAGAEGATSGVTSFLFFLLAPFFSAEGVTGAGVTTVGREGDGAAAGAEVGPFFFVFFPPAGGAGEDEAAGEGGAETGTETNGLMVSMTGADLDFLFFFVPAVTVAATGGASISSIATEGPTSPFFGFFAFLSSFLETTLFLRNSLISFW
jgi:hypothetical protein